MIHVSPSTSDSRSLIWPVISVAVVGQHFCGAAVTLSFCISASIRRTFLLLVHCSLRYTSIPDSLSGAHSLTHALMFCLFLRDVQARVSASTQVRVYAFLDHLNVEGSSVEVMKSLAVLQHEPPAISLRSTPPRHASRTTTETRRRCLAPSYTRWPTTTFSATSATSRRWARSRKASRRWSW